MSDEVLLQCSLCGVTQNNTLLLVRTNKHITICGDCIDLLNETKDDFVKSRQNESSKET